MTIAQSSPYALVRPPAETLERGVVRFIDRVPVDIDLARRQWAAYVDALNSNGWPTVALEQDDALPDSVFIEDAVVMFDDLAVITKPGEPSRSREIEATSAIVERLGIPVERITAGTLDGGDVLKIDHTAYVGVTGSTTTEAIVQLSELLAPRGWNVVPVPVTKALHLKSAVTALPDGTVIGYPPLVDDPGIFAPHSFLAVPEDAGSHVVLLDEHTVLISAAAPETARLLEPRGLRTVPVEISEFEKLEGCVTCLSVRGRETNTTLES